MKIIDGANPSVVTTLWTGPSAWVQPADHNYTTTFAFAGCQVISLAGRPHILAGTMRVHSNIGARVKAGQQIFVNQGGMNFERRELQYHVPYSSTRRVYMAATRSVKCRNYPSALVREGFNPGALCFFAAYDAHQDHGEVNWGTNTALLKIEMSSTGVVSAMDITASSGLPWVSGAYGTVVGHFNVFNGKSELLNMMDSAFLDFNDDNLPDLITVGQHINPHVSQMIFDRTRPAGIRFGPTTRMLGTSREPMTEYLTVNAFGDVNPNLNMNCLFFTGEQEENTLAPWNVRSHIRCYEGGSLGSLQPPWRPDVRMVQPRSCRSRRQRSSHSSREVGSSRSDDHEILFVGLYRLHEGKDLQPLSNPIAFCGCRLRLPPKLGHPAHDCCDRPSTDPGWRTDLIDRDGRSPSRVRSSREMPPDQQLLSSGWIPSADSSGTDLERRSALSLCSGYPRKLRPSRGYRDGPLKIGNTPAFR